MALLVMIGTIGIAVVLAFLISSLNAVKKRKKEVFQKHEKTLTTSNFFDAIASSDPNIILDVLPAIRNYCQDEEFCSVFVSRSGMASLLRFINGDEDVFVAPKSSTGLFSHLLQRYGKEPALAEARVLARAFAADAIADLCRTDRIAKTVRADKIAIAGLLRMIESGTTIEQVAAFRALDRAIHHKKNVGRGKKDPVVNKARVVPGLLGILQLANRAADGSFFANKHARADAYELVSALAFKLLVPRKFDVPNYDYPVLNEPSSTASKDVLAVWEESSENANLCANGFVSALLEGLAEATELAATSEISTGALYHMCCVTAFLGTIEPTRTELFDVRYMDAIHPLLAEASGDVRRCLAVALRPTGCELPPEDRKGKVAGQRKVNDAAGAAGVTEKKTAERTTKANGMKRTCGWRECGKVEDRAGDGARFRACSRCHVRFYCSVDCHEADWNRGTHKSVCTKAAA